MPSHWQIVKPDYGLAKCWQLTNCMSCCTKIDANQKWPWVVVGRMENVGWQRGGHVDQWVWLVVYG